MKAWLLIAVTGIMFGTLGLCTKFLTTRGVDPFICAAIPFSVSAAIALFFHPRRRATPWKEGVAMGAVNAAIPALLFNLGFSRLPASLVTLTIGLSPVFTALTAHLAFRDDRFTVPKFAGLALSFGGVSLLSGLPAGSGPGSALAFALTLTGAALAGGSLVWVRTMVTGQDPRTVLAPMQTGAAIAAVVAATLGGHPPWDIGADPGSGALGVVILGLMGAGTFASYVASLKASEIAPASRVGLMGYLVPLVGVGGGVVFFDEALTANLVLGGALILAGVALVGKSNHPVGHPSPG